MSEAVSGAPSRAATSVATPCFESWNGCARVSACTDGELAGRKLLCESLATSERPGKALTEKIVMTTHAIRIGQRNRTEKTPIKRKAWVETGSRSCIGPILHALKHLADS